MDGFHWLTFDGDREVLGDFDRHGLRAILALLRHVTGCKAATAALAPGAVRVTLPAGCLPNPAATTLLTEVSLWGDLEVRVQGQDFLGTTQRKLSRGRIDVTAFPSPAPRVLYLLLKEH